MLLALVDLDGLFDALVYDAYEALDDWDSGDRRGERCAWKSFDFEFEDKRSGLWVVGEVSVDASITVTHYRGSWDTPPEDEVTSAVVSLDISNLRVYDEDGNRLDVSIPLDRSKLETAVENLLYD